MSMYDRRTAAWTPRQDGGWDPDFAEVRSHVEGVVARAQTLDKIAEHEAFPALDKGDRHKAKAAVTSLVRVLEQALKDAQQASEKLGF